MTSLPTTIPLPTIQNYWHEQQGHRPDEIFSALRKLHDQQYPIMVYLMKAEGDGLNEPEHQMMYYLGGLIVGVMMAEFPAIPEVPEAAMVEARELNVSMLGFLGSQERPEQFCMDLAQRSRNQS